MRKLRGCCAIALVLLAPAGAALAKDAQPRDVLAAPIPKIRFKKASDPGSSVTWLLVPFDRSKVVKQLTPGDCAPASVFNALSLGPPELRAAIERLDGATIADKYRTFFERIVRKPSEANRGTRPRTSAKETALADVRFILADAVEGASAPRYRGDFALRADGEPLGWATARIHGQLKRSLRAGVLPILSYAGHHGAHSVAVLGVTEGLVDGSIGVRYFDPFFGEPFTLWTREETKKSFSALDGATHEAIAGLATPSGETINAPYLKIRTDSPDQPLDGPDDFFILGSLLGDFEIEKIDVKMPLP